MSKKSSVIKHLIVFLGHTIFWVVIYFFYSYFLGFGSTNTKYVRLFSTFLMPITIFISYFLAYYLIPQYLLSKKFKLFILYSIYTFILSVYAIILSILYGLIYSEGLKEQNTSPLTKTLPFIVLGVFFVVMIVVLLSLIMHHYRSTLKNEDLKSKILQTKLQLKDQELKFLKMQIHPHFLFNTLNTLYGFALKKSEETPEMILKLSNLLDYILYQIEKPSVLLNDELQHIEDYIALEKMRFQNTLKVHFTTKNNNAHFQIAPMLLLPFVENAFKHGRLVDGLLNIEIFSQSIDNQLNFVIKNTNINDESNQTKEGIGLENIKKRLDLLYHNNYTLAIENSENWFKVNLSVSNLKTLKNV